MRANNVLILMSDEALRSEWVTEEWGGAIVRQKRLIPILIDDCRSVPPFLSARQYVDARAGVTPSVIATARCETGSPGSPGPS